MAAGTVIATAAYIYIIHARCSAGDDIPEHGSKVSGHHQSVRVTRHRVLWRLSWCHTRTCTYTYTLLRDRKGMYSRGPK